MNSTESPLNRYLSDQETYPKEILLAACRCFAKTGYHGTTLRTIAQAAEVPLGSLNYHFGNKEKVYKAVVQILLAVARQFGEDVEQVLAAMEAENQPAIERIQTMLGMWVDFHFEHPEFSQIALHQMAEFDMEEPLKNMHEVMPVDDYAINKMASFFDSPKDNRFKGQIMASNMVITGFVGGMNYHRKMLGGQLGDKNYKALVKQTIIESFTMTFLQDRPES